MPSRPAWRQTGEAALALAQKYHDPGAPPRPSPSSPPTPRSTLRHLGVTSEDAQLYERLAVAYALRRLFPAAAPEVRARNVLGQSGLWAHGISGDLPILLVRVVEEDDVPLVRQVLQAQDYWRLKGLARRRRDPERAPGGYLDEMHQVLTALLESGTWAAYKDRPGGVFLLRGEAWRRPSAISSRPWPGRF